MKVAHARLGVTKATPCQLDVGFFRGVQNHWSTGVHPSRALLDRSVGGPLPHAHLARSRWCAVVQGGSGVRAGLVVCGHASQARDGHCTHLTPVQADGRQRKRHHQAICWREERPAHASGCVDLLIVDRMPLAVGLQMLEINGVPADGRAAVTEALRPADEPLDVQHRVAGEGQLSLAWRVPLAGLHARVDAEDEPLGRWHGAHLDAARYEPGALKAMVVDRLHDGAVCAAVRQSAGAVMVGVNVSQQVIAQVGRGGGRGARTWCRR